MKKILMSLMVIAVAVGLVAGASGAWFFDTEESTGNVFQAGTIDLGGISLSGDNVASGELVLEDVKPCEELGQFYVTFHNVGQNEGKVSWVLTYENNDKAGDENLSPDGAGVALTADEFAMLVFVDYSVFDRNVNGIIEPFGGDDICDYDGVAAITIGDLTDEDLNQDNSTNTGTSGDLDDQMAYVLANWVSPISYVYPWPGAPGGIDDEWVLPDWARWGDKTKGNNDGYLTLYEIATLAAADPLAWSIDDLSGATIYMDPSETYMHKIGLHLADSVDNYTDRNIQLGVANNDAQGDGITITVTVTLRQVP